MFVASVGAVFLLCSSSGIVLATDYFSVADNVAILYDAPSLKAKKVFLVSRYLPLEQLVNLDNWVKVRDQSGGIAWIEKRSLSSKRYVEVTATVATLHQAADAQSEVVTQVKQQVALEWLEPPSAGWVKVRHPDGVTGYVKSNEVWGD